jgi:hypothetical protein
MSITSVDMMNVISGLNCIRPEETFVDVSGPTLNFRAFLQHHRQLTLWLPFDLVL